MKRLVQLSGLILLVCAALFFGVRYLQSASGLTADNTFRLYNWGDYIDPELIGKFEEETGYAVSYETFDSNEAMYTKVKQGGTSYDLIVPSEYMISKMIDENLLLELDHKKIKGLEHIDDDFLDQPFDEENRFSIPYFWGTLGIIYNDQVIEEVELARWSDLWKADYKESILFIDGAREMMGIGLHKNGLSANEEDPDLLRQVAEDLKFMMPNAKGLLADEIKMYMVQEEAPIAVTFSGEAADMIYENEHLHYVIPEEGSNLWFDNMIIPRNAQNTKAAYAFINFMLEPENAAQNAEYIGYSTPNKDALSLMDPAIANDPAFYPEDAALEKMEVYENLPNEILGLYNDLFLEVKMTQ